ncbi:tRNA-uridine aminocarboxypropyltransferase [Halobacteriovorax sp. JY17]|uniref:tRNA-uridine aminocarboxypropyltransferase n=1 Tax=Halobacteriovorax sp. JY17 TaxID=2014617 RepID=UPI000C4874AD|nr:tRNA-uridine aminocarboxypropyltransferase [Halobacteriovorax sp. JY17]PIK15354.1 MAG: hypothetical protein CES88_01165 [Halobacteriovorax sp. JY17]
MTRAYCNRCKRALRGCICKYAVPIVNKNFITILRHPSEIKNIKGTAALLALSLSNIKLLDGEIFSSSEVLKTEMDNYLLFPSETSLKVSESPKSESRAKNFIFIDGTWKKAYKILQLNSFLKEINHLSIELNEESLYSQIRKQKSGGLSTLESVTYTLKEFEKEITLEELEASFKKFIENLKSLST